MYAGLGVSLASNVACDIVLGAVKWLLFCHFNGGNWPQVYKYA